MNWKKRSLEIQRRMASIQAERRRLRDEHLRLSKELAAMTPRRPRTGTTQAIRAVLEASDRPLTSSEIADRLPERDRHRVLVMVHQLARTGRIEAIPIKPKSRGFVRIHQAFRADRRDAA